MRYAYKTCYGKEVDIEELDLFCQTTFAEANCAHQEEMLFALHEAIINALEAVTPFERREKTKIEIMIEFNQEYTVAKVFNFVTEDINIKKTIDEKNIDQDLWNSRGRGLFFIKNLVDDYWQEKDELGRFGLVMKKWNSQVLSEEANC